MRRSIVHPPTSTAGFTLIEVLVVILIAGVLAALAAPGFLGYMRRQQVGSVRSDLSQALRSAQQQAEQRRETVTVAVANEAGRPILRINGVLQPLGGDDNPGNVQITPFSTASGTKNTTITQVQFDYQGLPIDNTVPFVISLTTEGASPAQQQCVIVANLLGSIKTAQGTDCDNPNLKLGT